MKGWTHGPWTSLLLWGFGPARQSLMSFSGKGGVLYSASGVRPKEGFQIRAVGPDDRKTQTRVRMGASGHGNLHMRALWRATERASLSTGLTLPVPMRVCAQGGPQAWAWPHGPCWFLLLGMSNTMPTVRFLAMGMEEF